MSRAPVVSGVDADLAFAAAQRVVQTHQRLVEFLKAGQTLGQIDAFVARMLADLGCRSCFLGYRVGRLPPFPSHACLSVNDCVVHGTAGSCTRPMRPGDVLKIDVGVVHRGWVGDAAWTYVFEDYPSAEVKRLMQCGKESLRRGVEELHPANTYLAWARTVQGYVEGECGFHLIRGLGGHGYGRWDDKRKKGLHEPPYLANVVPTYSGEWPDALVRCAPGTVLAAEPMIALGTGQVKQHAKEWPVYTADGSTAVHYEHDVMITESGPRVLSEGMENLPDVVG
jgi:methionyl aminopeptidase